MLNRKVILDEVWKFISKRYDVEMSRDQVDAIIDATLKSVTNKLRELWNIKR